MSHKLIVLATVFISLVWSAAVRAGAEDAMFQAAKFFYETSLEEGGEQRRAGLQNARDVLDDIVTEYPTSDLAIRVLLGEVIDGVDVSAIDRQLAEYGPLDDASDQPTLSEAPGNLGEGVDLSETSPIVELSRDERFEVQRRLNFLGHDPKGVDGVFGPGTRAAISSWQSISGFPATGYITVLGLQALREQSHSQYAAWQANRAASAKAKPKRVQGRNGWFLAENGMYCRGTFFGWCQRAKPNGF